MECEGLIAHGLDLSLFLRLAPREMEKACCQAVLGFKAFTKLFKYYFEIQFVIFPKTILAVPISSALSNM